MAQPELTVSQLVHPSSSSRRRRRRGPHWAWALSLAGLVLLAATLAFSPGSVTSGRFESPEGAAAAAPRGRAIPITVGAPLHVRAIASGFLGISLEYRTIEQYAGRNPHAINTVLVRLIRALSPGARPELRIGGDSTDRTWWPEPHVPKPLGAYIKLTPHWGAVAAALVHALDARVTLGIQLEADSGRVAGVEARRIISAIGRPYVRALELGNEPELYDAFTWYHTAAGLKEPGRPLGYNFADYLQNFNRVSASLPDVPLAGPSVGKPKWIAYVGSFLDAEPRVGIVTVHKYPLQLCYVPPGARSYPTLAHLLDPASTTGLATSVAPTVAVAHAHGLPIRVDEVNTISCGQAPRVGKSFATALWALQTLFAFARVGVDGVDMHSYVGAPYALFRFHHSRGAWRGIVYPEYYGMLLFTRAAPPGARLLSTTERHGTGIQVWATRAHGLTHVVLINESRDGRNVSVRVPGGGRSATVQRLQASGLGARGGVSLGGQSFGSSTRTGAPAGDFDVQVVRRIHGAYRIGVDGASAAMLTTRTHG
jgi:hypothetical protein